MDEQVVVLDQQLTLDWTLVRWVLLPIMAVMFLVGILRHHATVYLTKAPKASGDVKATREAQALLRLRVLHANGSHLHDAAFARRKAYMVEAIESKRFLKTLNEPSGPGAMMVKTSIDCVFGSPSVLPLFLHGCLVLFADVFLSKWESFCLFFFFFLPFLLHPVPSSHPVSCRFSYISSL